MSVVPFRKCKCGQPGTMRLVHWENDTESQTIELIACDKCWNTSGDFLAHVRPVFDAMIACGCPRDIANDTMTFMLESWNP
jgi:hypothetical protein